MAITPMRERAFLRVARLRDWERTDLTVLTMILRTYGRLFRHNVRDWLSAARPASVPGYEAVQEILNRRMKRTENVLFDRLLERIQPDGPTYLDPPEDVVRLIDAAVAVPPYGLLVLCEVYTTAAEIGPWVRCVAQRLHLAGPMGEEEPECLKLPRGEDARILEAAIEAEAAATTMPPDGALNLGQLLWDAVLQLKPQT